MSKIEVNKIGPQCGTTLTVGCGAGQTVVADAATVTLGRCGGTVALASGATQSGFGRSGSVNWQTGSIKSSATFSAADGEGYFVDTSSNAVTANLPAGSAGAIVAFADYTRTFATNNLTISPNGSEKIGGVADDASIDLNGQGLTLVYVDGTEGWINVQNAENTETGLPPFIEATGGTVTCCGNFKIHTFTGPGTFTVNSVSSTAANNTIGYVVVAGGAGGAARYAGGGGAGGYREGRNVPVDNFTASPLVANAPTNAITVTAQGYPITVGGGGVGTPAPAGTPKQGGPGNNSIFSIITSAGGGGGGGEPLPAPDAEGLPGGSGGGGTYNGSAGGTGNTPPTSPPQGNNGGTGNPGTSVKYGGAGGGGAGAVGTNGTSSASGPGGAGVSSSITGASVARAGGGGAGGNQPGSTPGTGGTGGGGAGAPTAGGSASGVAGTANTGGGGGGGTGGGTPSGSGGAGGSGVVIIRYKFQ